MTHGEADVGIVRERERRFGLGRLRPSRGGRVVGEAVRGMSEFASWWVSLSIVKGASAGEGRLEEW